MMLNGVVVKFCLPLVQFTEPTYRTWQTRRVLNRIAAASGFRSPHRANVVRRQFAIEGALERKRGSP